MPASRQRAQQVAGEIPRLVVRLLDGRTGSELWKDEDAIDSARGAGGNSVAWTGSRILVGGLVTRDHLPDYYDDPLVIAYDASSGTRLWLDELDAAKDMAVVGLAAREDQAFALVRVSSGASHQAKAYDTGTTRRLWDTGPELLFTDGQLSVPLLAGGAVVFAADAFSSPSEFLATALDAADGTTAWRADAHAAGATSSAAVIAIDGARLHVAGSVSEQGTPARRLGLLAPPSHLAP